MGLIRVTLALAVLLGHLPLATFKFMGPGLAVQGFFIVSGFYMALVLSGKYADRGLFYSNRLLRLLPTYFVMMALCAIALFGFGITATSSPEVFARAFSQAGTALLMVFENLALVGQELLYWFKLSPAGLQLDLSGAPPTEELPVAWQALLVPQSWSLSMELMFYALAPFLVRWSTRALVLLALASLALRLSGHLLPLDYGLWQGRLFPTALFLFLMGMLAHRALPQAERAPLRLRQLLGPALIALIVCLPVLELPPEAARFSMYLAIAVATPFIFSAWKDSAVDRWVGDLSYPMYLCHLLIVALVLQYEPPQGAWVAIGASFALSALLLVLVDRPVDRWRQARLRARSA